ncbi:MAG TPA: PEGA domain-containing protein [Myxococcota bacterium]|jgi:hypothetical protein|nr:PEGA domain-containing protein [Myxococcota bacterium]
MSDPRPVAAVAALVAASAAALALAGAPAVAHAAAPAKKYTVSIESVPPGASIYVDDKAAGTLGYTPAKIKLTAGTKTLYLVLDGYAELKIPLIVAKKPIAYYTFTLSKAARPASIDIRPSATDPSAVGAEAWVDDVPWGPLPVVKEVPAGRHMVVVRKAGFTDWTLWVDSREGDRSTLVVEMKPGDMSGSIEINGTEGGAVYVDGALKGTSPTVVDKVGEGRHLVEVKKPGYESFSMWVDVKARAKSDVSAFLKESGPVITTGILKIFTNADPADVKVDGTPMGKSPLEIPKVAAGSHFIEVSRAGYDRKEELVDLKSGESRVIKLEMSPTKLVKGGTISVRAALPGASVYLDGGPRGPAPMVADDVAPGKHIVTVRKDGYKEWRMEVDVGVGTKHEFVAELRAVGTMRVILTNVEGATVSVDGAVVGSTPIKEYDVPSGRHTLIIDKAGWQRYVEEFDIAGGEIKNFTMAMVKLYEGPTPEEIALYRKTLSPLSAKPVKPRYVAIVLMGGYPYFVDTRIASGAFEKGPKFPFSLDFGFAIRSNYFITEFEGMVKAAFISTKQFSLGLDLGLGGGAGPCSTDTYFLNTDLLMSAHFRDVATATLFLGVQGWTDGSNHLRNDSASATATGCSTGFDAYPGDDTLDVPQLGERNTRARWIFGGTVELHLMKRLGLVLRFYGPPSLPVMTRDGTVFNQRERPLYNVGFLSDFKYYFQGGVEFKF